jgi:hypothetical protein
LQGGGRLAIAVPQLESLSVRECERAARGIAVADQTFLC